MLAELRTFDAARVLALNNAHEIETSRLDAARLQHLLDEAFFAQARGDLAAMLLAFDQDADYDSPNFLWFRARLQRFVYVDRVITAAGARRTGHARALYEALFARAADAGHDRVVCEVNSDPPNPGSDAFHAALGFAAMGRARLGNGKTVRYLARAL
jgi:predicted GNAT superfamily acetyltransferase